MKLILSKTIEDFHLKSQARESTHFFMVSKRNKICRTRVLLAFTGMLRSEMCSIGLCLPVVIRLTRLAPRELDTDNLAAAFKPVRDCVADLIRPGFRPGRADGTKLMQWEYEQKKGKPKEYAVIVEIFREEIKCTRS